MNDLPKVNISVSLPLEVPALILPDEQIDIDAEIEAMWQANKVIGRLVDRVTSSRFARSGEVVPLDDLLDEMQYHGIIVEEYIDCAVDNINYIIDNSLPIEFE